MPDVRICYRSRLADKAKGAMSFLEDLEKRIMRHYNVPADTPQNARKARFYNRWLDHAVLRGWWTNMDQIATDVWRGNHPPPHRFRQLPQLGIKTVISLRGASDTPFHREEVALCQELGLELITISLSARGAPRKKSLLALMDAFDAAERPLFFHCKSGADRAGLASAIYLMTKEGATPQHALGMLSTRYLHLKGTKTGVLDRFLLTYIARNDRAQIGFRDWVTNEYDSKQLKADFDRFGLRNIAG